MWNVCRKNEQQDSESSMDGQAHVVRGSAKRIAAVATWESLVHYLSMDGIKRSDVKVRNREAAPSLLSGRVGLVPAVQVRPRSQLFHLL